MKLALDTVVLGRAHVGPVGPLGRLAFDSDLDLEWIASPEVVHEDEDGLHRAEPQRHFRRLADRTLEGLAEPLDRATLVHPDETPRVCRDPNDAMILAAASTGGAHALDPGDKDLRSRGVYEGMRTCTTQTTIDLLGECDAMEYTT